MSQLRKQTVVGKKPARRASSAPVGSPRTNSVSFLKSAYRASAKAVSWSLVPLRASLKRWPRATLLVTLSAVALGALGYGLHRAMDSMTRTLPERIEVTSPRPELHSLIATIASDTLTTARREQWSRTALADKLLSRISMLDGVDEVTLRAGLDKKLRINVLAQAPLLVIEGKDNERILVGSKFKIIARGLGANDYGHLPYVEAPDLNLNIRTMKEKRRANTGLFVRPSTSSTANIRWLSQQVVKIQSLFESEKIPVDVVKISWKSGSGFAAVVKQRELVTQLVAQPYPSGSRSTPEQASATQTVGPHKFTIILGENQFTEKFSRLGQLMQDLRLKKSLVDQIDLAYSDKAIIKMSDQLTDARHGGLQ